MSDHEIGYRKPPRKSRFKVGVSGNLKGRPRRKPTPLSEIIHGVLSAPMEYREQGRVELASRLELSLKILVDQAVKGDPNAAEFLLKVRAHAQRYGDAGVETLQIENWLPDYPGQTANQKTQEFGSTGEADPLEWWHRPEKRSGSPDDS